MAKVLGQDLLVIQNQLLALLWNIFSWFLEYIPPAIYSRARPSPQSSRVCISINGPGGLDRLTYQDLPKDCIATAGYNLPGIRSPFVSEKLCSSAAVYADDHVIVKTSYFSVNYADVTIRWGLYESALRYVGWPIVPGFDFSGKVIWAGSSSGFREGDEVFGFTLFGAYSNRILVPSRQLRHIPRGITHDIAAAIPAVAGTAIHAVSIAGGWPAMKIFTKNKAVLVHSAAGAMKEPPSPHARAHLSQEESDQCCFRFVNFVATRRSWRSLAQVTRSPSALSLERIL
jgi:synaptic vesicle membrane protein VAT-1